MTQHLLRWSGVLALALGIVALIGWICHWDTVLQFSPRWSPVRWSSALGLSAVGAATILLSNGRRDGMVMLLGVVAGCIGAVTLLQYGVGRSFGIDELFTQDYIAATAAYPARMSMLSATCFTLLGAGLVFAASKQAPIWRLAVTGLAACAVLVVALLSILGSLAGIEVASTWGSLTRMALSTAIAFILLGGALLAWAWDVSNRAQFNFARWLPITGSVTLMGMVACVAAASLVKLKDSMYWRKHTYEVLVSSQAMLAHLVDSQRGMRGYVLTQHPKSLETYRVGARMLPAQLHELQVLTRDNPSQQKRIAQMTTDLSQVLAYAGHLLEARDSHGLQQAIDVEATGEGQRVVNRLREDLDAFSAEEHRLLVQRDAAAQKDFNYTTRLLVASSLVAAVLLILAHGMASREVNRRRRTEAKLEEVSTLQAAILDSANYAIVSTTVDGLVRTFNATAERWLGYRAEEIIGRATPAIWHDPQELEAQATQMSRELGHVVAPGFDTFAMLARRERGDETEWTIIRKDGSRFPASLSSNALTDSSGRIVGYLAVLGDISERRQHEAALRLSETRFRHAFDDAPIGMCLVSPGGRLLKVNRALCSMLGYPEEDLLRSDFQSLTHPEDAAADVALVARVLAGEIPCYQIEKRYRHRDGSAVYASLSVSLVRDRDNAPLYLIAQIENIAHRREMDRLKHEFVSTVSHELRTPLTSIRGSLGLVDAGALGALPEKARAMVRIAHQNSERLVRIINDILDVEKIESGKLELHFQQVPIAALLRQAVEENVAYGEKFKVAFVLESVPEHAQVHADPDRLMQVMTNLLSNAAKFSPPGAQVRVRAQRNGGRINIEVQDHGTGIPEAFRGRVFEKFAQADATSSRRFEGTGLGLSITRQLVQAMGGTIGFKTETGQGTTFHFNLALVQSNPHARDIDFSVTGRHRVLFYGKSAALADKGPTTVPRILHVEDDVDLSRVIETALAGRADIVTAPTLEAAQEQLRNGAFSLVILDLGLPDGSGLTLLDQLEGATPEPVPVVILSVSEVPRSVQQRVAAALVKSRLSEADVVNTILSFVERETQDVNVAAALT